MATIILKIEERNGAIYQITQTGKYRFVHEGMGGKQTAGKCMTGFEYQILVDMVKMEPERFNLIVDNGDLIGLSHLSVHTIPGILRMYPHFVDTDQGERIARCEKELVRTQKVVEYDQEHGIKTNFYTGWD